MEEAHIAAKSCDTCGEMRHSKAVYCDQCGTKLTIICLDCDQKLPEPYPYCPFTGNKLKYQDPKD